jgi:hypothetical protein
VISQIMQQQLTCRSACELQQFLLCAAALAVRSSSLPDHCSGANSLATNRRCWWRRAAWKQQCDKQQMQGVAATVDAIAQYVRRSSSCRHSQEAYQWGECLQ